MRPSKEDTTCGECGFGLWIPIGSFSSSHVGLYSDARFRGRCIVTLNEHADHMEDLPADTVSSFMLNVSLISRALRIATGAERINVAVLGNQEGHVHAHLIPRYPDSEPFPNKAPWEDTRARAKLPPADEAELVATISRALVQVSATSTPSSAPNRARSTEVEWSQPPLSLLSFEWTDAHDVLDARK